MRDTALIIHKVKTARCGVYGIDIEIRYADTGELAHVFYEEVEKSPRSSAAKKTLDMAITESKARGFVRFIVDSNATDVLGGSSRYVFIDDVIEY
jgi:hypothetical protein